MWEKNKGNGNTNWLHPCDDDLCFSLIRFFCRDIFPVRVCSGTRTRPKSARPSCLPGNRKWQMWPSLLFKYLQYPTLINLVPLSSDGEKTVNEMKYHTIFIPHITSPDFDYKRRKKRKASAEEILLTRTNLTNSMWRQRKTWDASRTLCFLAMDFVLYEHFGMVGGWQLLFVSILFFDWKTVWNSFMAAYVVPFKGECLL